MVAAGEIEARGRTRARKYRLARKRVVRSVFPITSSTAEHEVWGRVVSPHMAGVPNNVARICAYGFQEMFNNVLDHSESQTAGVDVSIGPGIVQLEVYDFGIGLWAKVMRDLGYEDVRDVVLQLAKGKLTTDPARHTGEGIFFTARMFDQFGLYAGRHYWACESGGRDWLLEDRKGIQGTAVRMIISPLTSRTEQEVFDRYSSDDDYAFSRSEVPVLLAEFSEDPLVSRSAARRVVAHLDRFREVVLNFKGVESIGQPFADEIFRVYANENPAVRLIPINTSPSIRRMISRAQGGRIVSAGN
jgi:anti-sigma regulatory factor (Ser/Thr protein kinase)